MSLYSFALRSGDRQLAVELAAILRGDEELCEKADRLILDLPRGRTRWTAGGERAEREVLERLGGSQP